jgi:hypothetical protein
MRIEGTSSMVIIGYCRDSCQAEERPVWSGWDEGGCCRVASPLAARHCMRSASCCTCLVLPFVRRPGQAADIQSCLLKTPTILVSERIAAVHEVLVMVQDIHNASDISDDHITTVLSGINASKQAS